MTINVSVAALGAGNEDAEPFFDDDWACSQRRSDWEGDIGLAFVASLTFAVAALGRYRGSSELRETSELALWSADSHERLAAVAVGPASSHRGAYAFEPLGSHVVLRAGREYRLTQRCWRGMLDEWPDAIATPEEVMDRTSTRFADFVGGVYNFHSGYPSFEDGALRRAGMLNFAAVPVLAVLRLSSAEATVGELKARLEEVTGIHPWQQRLILGDDAATDLEASDATLARSGVEDGAYLRLAVRSGAFFATAGADRSARLWSLPSGECTQTYRGHTDDVLSVEFSPSFGYVVTASADRTARLWDTTSGKCLWIMEGHSECVRVASFARISPFILTASEDRTARIWHSERRCCLSVLTGHVGAVIAAAFSPDEEKAFTASLDGTTKLWNVADGSYIRTLSGQQGSIVKAAFSLHESSALLTLCIDAREPVALWSVDSGLRLRTLGKDMVVHDASLSPDGVRVLTACADQTLRLWAAESGDCLLELVHGAQVLRTMFSLDGSIAASADGNCELHSWRLADGCHLQTLAGHAGKITSLAFAPGSDWLVSTSADATARLWDVSCGEGGTAALATLAGHRGAVLAGAASP
eukprot:TRINITY_DN10362_c0_g1_i2.p1 TRINITY_DN10362_c0_g1~~TRINITY_DN10362_c0_g1_i2.p1  ORF type:complete len:586 (-),score=116.88 TRINITY_DN10362_c0_g1_i2:67-1824(-)